MQQWSVIEIVQQDHALCRLENDTCHFTVMNHDVLNSDPNLAATKPRVGRPRRGTEAERTDLLIAAATRAFLRDGYGSTSIDKVASEAGVSTRTIYERFKNKGDLLGAVISRLVERDMETVLATEELDRLEPRQALTRIGEMIGSGYSSRSCSRVIHIRRPIPQECSSSAVSSNGGISSVFIPRSPSPEGFLFP